MADAVTTNVILDDPRLYIAHFTNVSDGSTGESEVTKVDISTLVAEDGAAPSQLQIIAVQWAIGVFVNVIIYYDATTDDVACVLPTGSGFMDYTYVPVTGAARTRHASGISDPQSTGTTGDIKFSTTGVAANATYDITLWLRKVN